MAIGDRPPAANGFDVGAWDGYFSFACERAGAHRVVALDHFVWSMDWEAARRYTEECRARGETAKPIEHTDAWKPEELPGKVGFDTAHAALDSQVEAVVADVLNVELEELGAPFDVVLYLGVLYHMRNPLSALERLCAATGDLAVIETDAIAIPGHESDAFCQFYERDELNADFTNWWTPNAKALEGLCRAAGFRDCITFGAPDRKPPPDRKGIRPKLRYLAGSALREFGLKASNDTDVTHYRLIAHAYK